MPDETTLRANLEEAENALHQFNMGAQVVEIEYEGHRQKFARSNVGQLTQYIRSIKVQLGESVGRRGRRLSF